jgi:hypothetical protein
MALSPQPRAYTLPMSPLVSAAPPACPRTAGGARPRRCSLTLLPLADDAAASGSALAITPVGDSVLLPFLDRPAEVRQLLQHPANKALLAALQAAQPEWARLEPLLAEPRGRFTDRAWLRKIRSVLGTRRARECDRLFAALGADGSLLVSSLSAAETRSASHARYDSWATSDGEVVSSDGDDIAEVSHSPVVQNTSDAHADIHDEPLDVEALHTLPRQWHAPQATLSPAAMLSRAPDVKHMPAHSRSPSQSHLQCSGSLPDIDEEPPATSLMRTSPPTTPGGHTLSSLPAPRSRRQSLSLDGSPADIKAALSSAPPVVGVRFVAGDVETRGGLPPSEEQVEQLRGAKFKRVRRLSSLVSPQLAPGAEDMRASARRSVNSTARPRSQSLAPAYGVPVARGVGVAPSQRRRLSFARSFGELNPPARALTAAPLATLPPGSPRADRSASEFASRADADGVPLLERIAQLEATGAEKPAWLGLLPDGRTRHPSAGAAAGKASLAAFRAGLGLEMRSCTPSSRSAVSSRTPSPAAGASTQAKLHQDEEQAAVVEAAKQDAATAMQRRHSSAAALEASAPVDKPQHLQSQAQEQPMPPATNLEPLVTQPRQVSRDSPSSLLSQRADDLATQTPTRIGGVSLAIGGGLSLRRAQPKLEAEIKSPTASAPQSASLSASTSPMPPTSATSITSPRVFRRPGGFAAFSREYERAYQARRRRHARASSSASIESVAFSTGSQAIASEDDDDFDDDGESELYASEYDSRARTQQDEDAAPLSSHAMERSFAAASSRHFSDMSDGGFAPLTPFSPSPSGRTTPASSACVSPVQERKAFATPVVSPSIAESWPSSWNSGAGSGASRAIPSVALPRVRREPTMLRNRRLPSPPPGRSTLLFAIPPSQDRRSALAALLAAPEASSVLAHISTTLGDGALTALHRLVASQPRADLSDEELLQRLGRDVFRLVDAASPSPDAHEEQERLCDPKYAERWHAFERLMKDLFGLDAAVVAEAHGRAGPPVDCTARKPAPPQTT